MVICEYNTSSVQLGLGLGLSLAISQFYNVRQDRNFWTITMSRFSTKGRIHARILSAFAPEIQVIIAKVELIRCPSGM